jgi:hypothetical protein
MAKLSTKARNKIPASKFGGPNRSYPIPDKSHAANAKARAAQFASPALRASIDAKADKVLSRASGGCCGHVTMGQLRKRHGEGV